MHEAEAEGLPPPLHIACAKGEVEIVEQLLSGTSMGLQDDLQPAPCNVNQLANGAPLHVAITSDGHVSNETRVDVVRRLLAANAAVNHENEKGHTPLILATPSNSANH